MPGADDGPVGTGALKKIFVGPEMLITLYLKEAVTVNLVIILVMGSDPYC